MGRLYQNPKPQNVVTPVFRTTTYSGLPSKKVDKSHQTLYFIRNMENLQPYEEVFIDTYLVNGNNGTQAILAAKPHLKYTSARTAAKEILAKPYIRKAIDSRAGGDVIQALAGRTILLQQTEDVRSRAKGKGKLDTELRAIDQKARIAGVYREEGGDLESYKRVLQMIGVQVTVNTGVSKDINTVDKSVNTTVKELTEDGAEGVKDLTCQGDDGVKDMTRQDFDREDERQEIDRKEFFAGSETCPPPPPPTCLLPHLTNLTKKQKTGMLKNQAVTKEVPKNPEIVSHCNETEKCDSLTGGDQGGKDAVKEGQ